MGTAWETYPVKFEGGWRTDLGRLDQGIQAPGSATVLQNFEVSLDGGYKKVKGYSKFSEDPVPGSDLISGVVIVNSSTVLVCRDGSYHLSTGDGWTAIEDTPTPTTGRVRHDHFNFSGIEEIVLVDGVNAPAFFNTIANTMVFDTDANAAAIGANIVTVFKNHIFFAKNNLLTFTAPYTTDDYNTGNGAGQINIGSRITGLITFRDQLIIFAADKILRLTGNTSTDFVLLPIANDTGCLCPDTIREVGGDIMYLGPDGLRYLSATERNNDFGLQRASSKIQTEINRIIGYNCVYTSLTIRSKNQYRLFTYIPSVNPQSSEGFIATVFSDQSVDNIAWSHIVGIKIYTADSKQFRDREIILFSTPSDYIYILDTGSSFDGDPIHAVFETPYMPITDPRKRKTFYKHSLYATIAGNFGLDVRLRLDYNSPSTIQPPIMNIGAAGGLGSVWGSPFTSWGQFVYSTQIEDIYLNTTVGSAFTVALRYEENSINPSYNLDYAVLEFRENERR